MGSDGSHNYKDTKAKLDYLKELLTDRNILANDPRTYLHVGKILEKEILRIRSALFATYGINQITDSELPEPEGPKVTLQSKVYMPSDNGNSFNFVGRILGPDGSTAKCLQQCLGVKIMVRGRGSMRDRKKEEANLGKPNWEHLNDKLHVVLAVEDYENRAQARLAKASEYITIFLKESMKGCDKDDKVKQMQLMELSFRRAPCHSWRFNGSNLLDIGFPQKSGPMFQNGAAANFFNFGYAYPPAGPLFSPLHPAAINHGVVNSLGLYGHHPQQQQQQQQQQQHPPSQQQQQYSFQQQQQQGGSTQPAQGTPLGAAGYNPPYAGNLNPNPFLFGQSPTAVTGYTSPYSPNSHAQQQTASIGTPALPINYWTNQAMPHLMPDYASTHGTSSKQQNQPNDDTSSVPTLLSPNDTQPSQDGQTSHTAMPEDLMQQYVLQELSDCHLNDMRDLKFQEISETSTLGTYSASTDLQSAKAAGTNNASNLARKLPYNSSSEIISHANTTNGSMPNRLTAAGKRYSQKQHVQSMDRLQPSQDSNLSIRGQGRTATVTVRIGTPLEQHALPVKKNIGKLKSSEPLGNGSGNIRSNSDREWPKLISTKDKEKYEQKGGHAELEENNTSSAKRQETQGTDRTE